MEATGLHQHTEQKSFDNPDEVREFPNGRAEIIRIGDSEIGRYTFQPGWHWDRGVKPIAGTDSCEVPHPQYHLSGRLGIRLDDGTELLAGPGGVNPPAPGPDGLGGGR